MLMTQQNESGDEGVASWLECPNELSIATMSLEYGYDYLSLPASLSLDLMSVTTYGEVRLTWLRTPKHKPIPQV